jgi:protoporphyrin/coproporphyrin ferrochelatase
VRLAVVLFNLGGPDSLEAVEPFLKNLFSDPAIISLPAPLRRPLAWFIAKRRAPIAWVIYEHMGGRSPILPETEAQARALETALEKLGHSAKCFIAMRYWRPFTAETVAAVKAYIPDAIVLLPLYPQFSTTTGSSLAEWRKEAGRRNLAAPLHEICCYPTHRGFADAAAGLLRDALVHVKPGISYRLLFSAHGLPRRVVEKGDPYQWQVEQTVAAIVSRLGQQGLDAVTCYQSRVGPLEWIGPATNAEIARAGREGKGLIVFPVAFVSEHSETLVELDIEYAKLAREAGVPDYVRVPAVRTDASFIGGLAELVMAALKSDGPITCDGGRLCPKGRTCGHRGAAPDA